MSVGPVALALALALAPPRASFGMALSPGLAPDQPGPVSTLLAFLRNLLQVDPSSMHTPLLLLLPFASPWAPSPFFSDTVFPLRGC